MDMTIRDIAIAMAAVILAAVICGVIIFFLIGNEIGQEVDQVEDTNNDDSGGVVIASPTTEVLLTTPVPTVFPTQVFIPTAQSGQSAQTVPQQVVFSTPVTPIPMRTNCTIRTDWLSYIVQAGDTLLIIADTIGSTVNELVLGNCIVDPDTIYVGQQLFLPSLPTTTTTGVQVVATLPAVGAGGGGITTGTVGTELLVIQPYVAYNGGVYTLRGGASVSITWANLPLNTTQVDFYFIEGSQPQALITSDLDMTDGAIINWTVPDQTAGIVLAYAILVDGTEVSTAPMQVITQ